MKRDIYLQQGYKSLGVKEAGKREFHISSDIRRKYNFSESLYQLSGNVIFANIHGVRDFCRIANEGRPQEFAWRFSEVNAMGLIDEINHYIIRLYITQHDPKMWEHFLSLLDEQYGSNKRKKMIHLFAAMFEPLSVYLKQETLEDYLNQQIGNETGWHVEMEELWVLYLENMNPAFLPYRELFDDDTLKNESIYSVSITALRHYLSAGKPFGPESETLFELLEKPAKLFPHSLQQQLEYMQRYWTKHFHLERIFTSRLIKSLFALKEEYRSHSVGWSEGKKEIPMYTRNWDEPEAFTDDHEWMPNVVMIAKNALVWLHYLSRKYHKNITRLDQIPSEELEHLASIGINTLWLIGIWQRSYASKRIKQIMGNQQATASAYSLDDNHVAENLGGWPALLGLKEQAALYGIRLASDMVPNHTGMDSRWVAEHPDYFLQRRDLPYDYQYTGENLTQREGLGLYLEDGYFRKEDAAVVFKRVDFHTGDVRYIYHGNDGTMMPWNDTAQIDFLNPKAREAVIQEIVNMSYNFSVIRLDAAMVLVKRHIQRLWYPSLSGNGDCIPSRSEYALSDEDFDRLMPKEFWREVIDRIAKERPQTLLIAEAFWMLEGYFVRSLGMHRVYNSAFMNMLMQEDNQEYRDFIKKTMVFDMGILKRFVNFMSNPDEKTAKEQFGSGDKYIGVLTLMVTLPGLPMFAHGQLEGFQEKYGMEFTQAQWKEEEDMDLALQHQYKIFPLLQQRSLFSESAYFRLYDAKTHHHEVLESVFAYSNCYQDKHAIVLFNNNLHAVSGHIHWSSPYLNQYKELKKETIADAIGLMYHEDHYVIFQEQRSQLWYIRKSTIVHEHGLGFKLMGYESQVFWNFEYVYDAFGYYAWIYHELGGRGVPYNLIETPPATFQLEKEIKEFWNAVLPLSQQVWSNFSHSISEDNEISNEYNREQEQIQELVFSTQEKDLLEQVALRCDSEDSVRSYFQEMDWLQVQRESDYLYSFQDYLTPKAREFFAEDVNLVMFVHYYFWLKKLHLVGVSIEILESDVIQSTLASWWRECSMNQTDIEKLHKLALALVQNPMHAIHDRKELDMWWQVFTDDTFFMYSAGLNVHEDIYYYHEESMIKALSLIVAVAYFEQGLQKVVYQNRSGLNWIQQYRRWLHQLEKSNYNYDRFCQLIIK
ncbi:alpha-amylase family glycosyl hydrolase [Entomospira nematocerorum]|uniref:Alpha-amylase n=1 Tax=Entomospira nematocerorum TaxID=2719987 RepID=A0A968GED5_9SPIO|nr:alpha-amylase family glycosyl hydrolase [Entomospira nematocera]NIZ47517.1 alpha-amylase [Entomospira nematocera]WDI33943.1 alpha-amylase family glycosyl hydrolase [Entomospira nematocera]